MGGRVADGVNVGSGVQVGGSSDIAVAFGTISVTDNCGCGAGGLSKPQEVVKRIYLDLFTQLTDSLFPGIC